MGTLRKRIRNFLIAAMMQSFLVCVSYEVTKPLFQKHGIAAVSHTTFWEKAGGWLVAALVGIPYVVMLVFLLIFHGMLLWLMIQSLVRDEVFED